MYKNKEKIPERMSVLYFSHNSKRLWDVRCQVRHCCELGKNPKRNGTFTAKILNKSAQKASRVFV
jgi:hypothetical protein